MTVPPINSASSDRGRKIARFHPEAIDISNRLRETDADAVGRIAASLTDIGLRTPISVRYYPERPTWLTPSNSGDALVLLTGAHRLAAAKQLGWEEIECIVYYEGDEIDAQLWEISENLHRAELTKAQRDEHIRRYAELLAQRELQSPQIDAIESKRADGRGHRGKGVASKIASETGLSKSTVERALKPERVDADKERREAAKAQRQTEQEEADRQRQEVVDSLPDHAKQSMARTAAARSAGKQERSIDALEAEIAELREANAVLEEINAALNGKVEQFEDMRVQFEQGGFDKVIAGRDEEIRVLKVQVETESRDKASWKRSADYWKGEAIKLGWSNTETIPLDDDIDIIPFDDEWPGGEQ